MVVVQGDLLLPTLFPLADMPNTRLWQRVDVNRHAFGRERI